MYFWAFDLDKYLNNRGLTFDYATEVPGLVSKNIKDILQEIDTKKYDEIKLEEFRKKYVTNIDNCTKKIVDFVIDIMKNKDGK